MAHHVYWIGGVASPPETFAENVRVNLARGFPELEPNTHLGEELHVACAGPSLRDTAHELKGQKHVWALNGAHDWLISQGIPISAGVAMAPEPQILERFQKPIAGLDYYLASHTNIELVDRILGAGGKVRLWHAFLPESWGVDYGDRKVVFGGGTIGLRVPHLAWGYGFRHLHIHGLDASISLDGRIGVDTPMYPDRMNTRQTFIAGDPPRAFVSMPNYARQVEDMGKVLRPLEGLQVTFYGDGLMQWAMKGI